MVNESGELVVLGLNDSSSWRVVGLSLFVPCEEVMVVSSSDSESLVAPGLAALFVPCEEAIVISSSGSGLVGRSVSVFFYLEGFCFDVAFVLVLVSFLRELLCRHFCIRCWTWRKLWRTMSWRKLWSPMSPIGVGGYPSCCLILTSRCWRTVSFYLVRWSELLGWAVGMSQIPRPNPVHFCGRLGRFLYGWRSGLYRREGCRSRYGCRICL
jgi:hypothetical protein